MEGQTIWKHNFLSIDDRARHKNIFYFANNCANTICRIIDSTGETQCMATNWQFNAPGKEAHYYYYKVQIPIVSGSNLLLNFPSASRPSKKYHNCILSSMFRCMENLVKYELIIMYNAFIN